MNFSTRPITVVDWDDRDTEVIKPEQFVLEAKSVSGSHLMDVGALCYKNRGLHDNVTNPKFRERFKGRRVDTTSLVPSRIKIINSYIEGLRSITCESNAAIGHFRGVEKFFEFFESQGVEITSFDEAVHQYGLYTKDLVLKGRTKSIKPLSVEIQQNLQRVAKKFLKWAFNVSETDILNKVPNISQKRGARKPVAPVNQEERNLYTHRCLALFKQISSQLMAGKRRLTIDLSPFEVDQVPDDAINRTNWTMLDHANLAILAFRACYFAITGLNTTASYTLKRPLGRIENAARGLKFHRDETQPKARAGYKSQTPEFKQKFAVYYMEYLRFIDWMYNYTGHTSDLLFPKFYSDGSAIRGFHGSNVYPLKEFFQTFGADALTTTQLRKGVSADFWKISGGNLKVVADKLNNNVRTVSRSYLEPTLEESGQQIGGYFDLLIDTVNTRTRSRSDIPVKIVGWSESTSPTPSGQCENVSQLTPKRAQGFNDEAPEPKCSEPDTCFFCDYHAAHADEIDIRRILSLREIIILSKSRAKNIQSYIEMSAPILARIDEILAEIERVLGGTDLIEQIQMDVENGVLDEYWADHYYFILDLED